MMKQWAIWGVDVGGLTLSSGHFRGASQFVVAGLVATRHVS